MFASSLKDIKRMNIYKSYTNIGDIPLETNASDSC